MTVSSTGLGNVVMKGYFKNPAATAEAFAGGWFHTGDLSRRRDRHSDAPSSAFSGCFNRGGEWMSAK